MPLSLWHQSTRGSKMILLRPARMTPSLRRPIGTICGSELIFSTLCYSCSVPRHMSGSVIGFHHYLSLPPSSTVMEAVHARLLKRHLGTRIRTGIRDFTSAFQSHQLWNPSTPITLGDPVNRFFLFPPFRWQKFTAEA